MESVEFRDLGSMEYKAAWDYQENLLQESLRIKSVVHNPDVVIDSKSLPTKHYLLFVEHPPVYTLGKSGKIENVLINEEKRQAQGIELFHTNSGGLQGNQSLPKGTLIF